VTVYTDWSGRIREVSREAAAYLEVSAKTAVGREFPLFFAADRLTVVTAMHATTGGFGTPFTAVLLTGKGRKRKVRVEIDRHGTDVLEWILHPLVTSG